ncbi:MAG: YceD family protein [Lachnospiraceae bacterium]|jgi:uncharacterized protein
MLIQLSDILSKEQGIQHTDASFTMEMFSCRLGDFPVIDKTDIAFTITNKGNKVLLIEGKGNVTLQIPCSRCLTEVAVPIPLDFDREVDMKLTEQERIEALDESNYICGGNLDVDQLVYNEILIGLPIRVLCKDDCKGICSHCGTNLNEGSCQCENENLDPRMAVIRDIFSKFKEV